MNVTAAYDQKEVLSDFSLQIKQGQITALLGPSGSGKTTVLRLFAGLLKPKSGHVVRPEKCAVVFQEDRLLPYATLRENWALVTSDQQWMEKTAALLGLGDWMDQLISTFSGGMKRRAGIAQAMLNDPKILILDEPTAGLDPNERIRFRNLISELSEERLVLLSTHIVSDVEYIANEIWLMKDGAIVHKGTAEELIASMPEKVWECYVERCMVSSLMNKYKISNMKAEADGALLRIISREMPSADAQLVEASLEDVFLYYFGEKAGEDDAAF